MSKNIEKQAETLLRGILGKLPDIKNLKTGVMPRGEDAGVDLRATFQKQGTRQTLLVEVKSSGQPRYARDAVNQLLIMRQQYPDAYGVFMAPYISEATAEYCTRNDIGYADLSGNCRLSFDSVFIERTGNPNNFNEKRELKSLFKPKSERILRVLLSNPRVTWKTEELAETAKTSLGQISNVRRLLLEQEWIANKKRGIELIEPMGMLAAWKENYQPDRNSITDYYSMNGIGEIELQISSICKQTNTRYAFTGFSGASRYAPFTTYKVVTVYMDPGPPATDDLPFKRVSSGGNIRILTPYDEGVFYNTQFIKGGNVAMPVQCYLDLKAEKARGEETAEALLDKEIKPAWQ